MPALPRPLARARGVALVAVATALAALAPGRAAAQATFDPAAVYAVPLDDAPRRGPADAPITIVEFSDFSCPYCNRAQGIVEQVERLYPGQVRWVFRHRPLSLDNLGAADAAAAAGLQGRFWPLHDRLFSVHGQVDRAAVELHAAGLGLDLARFRADLDSGRARAVVMADNAVADRLGLTGTPTFFVNGRAVVGARGLSVFSLLIDEELVRARAAAAGRPAELYAALVADGRSTADAIEPPRLARQLAPGRTYRVGLGLPGHADGPDDALVTVVVWSDFECPYCAQLAPILARLRRDRGDEVKVVLRHMPLPGHAGADLAAEVAVEAARAGKLWAFYDRLFAERGELARARLEAMAVAVGVEPAAVAAAIADHRHRDRVMADGAAASALGVSGTPTLFVNGRPLVGVVPYDDLLEIVDGQLAAGRALVAEGVPPGDVYSFLTRTADEQEVGDPRALPQPRSIAAFEPGPAEREAAIHAACRAGDAAGARALAAGLHARRPLIRALCADRGVDLP